MDHIISPRPFYYEDVNPKGKRSLVLGTKNAGLLIYVTSDGIEFNGYYYDIHDRIKYGLLRDFVLVSWADLEIMKESLNRKQRRRHEKVKIVEGLPDLLEEEVNQEYLDRLPIVTLNGMKFYIDADRRERRPVLNPSHVFKFKTAFKMEEE